MATLRFIPHAVPLALLVLAAWATAQPEPAAEVLTVYHAFATTGSGDWATVSMPLDPSAWRVGSPDGPAASRSQLEAVLASLKQVVVGAHCKGADSGATHYPCSFELAAPTDAASPGALRIERQWASTSGDLLRRYDDRGAPASVLAWSSRIDSTVAMQPQGLKAMLDPDSGFVGLYASDAVTAGTARSLGFRFRVHSNEVSPSSFVPMGGVLILSTGSIRTVPTQTPPRPGTAA